MTKQEQIEEMAVIGCVRNPQAHTAEECAKCDFKQGQCNAYRHAEKLYNAGYRKVPDWEVVLTPEERDDLIAKVGVLGRENYDLNAENKQLKTECALLDDELRIARQNTIDVLNELKEKAVSLSAIETYHICNLVDEMIKEQLKK